METPSAYSNIVSPRSRRLRTIGIVLLIAVCAMVAYGYFGLMPSVLRAVRESSASAATSAMSAAHPPGLLDQANAHITRNQRIRKMRIAIALAYWGVCGLLLVSVVFVAWLDLREISRQYVAERRAMWNQAADRIDSPDDGA